MIQRICPICDQTMKSAHYCKNCKSWVKQPYVRDVAYYLNERHPEDETVCSYHDTDRHRILKAEHKGMGAGQQTAQTGASPDGVWKPVGMSQGSGRPQDTWQPQRERSGRRRSGSWAVRGILLVAALISVMGPLFHMAVNGLGDMLESASGYDIDLGDYTGEVYEGDYQELEETDVIARGEACNSRGHFAIQGEELTEPVVAILQDAGYQIAWQDTYSYNGIYGDGESWYTTWTTIAVKEEEKDSYQCAELDSDTGTGNLHEISLTLDDPQRLTDVTCAILAALEERGELPAGADCIQAVARELPAALKDETGYVYLEGVVLIEGIAFDDTYSVYISHNIDSDM